MTAPRNKPARKHLIWTASVAAAIAALAACQPQTNASDGAATPALVADRVDQGCVASTESAWIDQETPLRRYTTEARTFGPTCDTAVAVLTVRAREGSPVFVWAGAVRHLFGLKDAADPSAMKTALGEWIDQSKSMYPTSDRLPEWPAGAEVPAAGEFPFYPEDWIDQSYWEGLRSNPSEVLCFPQGMESMLCAVLRDGELETIGVQTFPG